MRSIEKYLGEAFAAIPKGKITQNPEELLFVKQLNMIRACLDCDNIHEANRTLLSQLVEGYFSVMDDDHVVSEVFIFGSFFNGQLFTHLP